MQHRFALITQKTLSKAELQLWISDKLFSAYQNFSCMILECKNIKKHLS